MYSPCIQFDFLPQNQQGLGRIHTGWMVVVVEVDVVVVVPAEAALGSQRRGVCSGSHPASISHENLGPNAKETPWRCVEEAGILTRLRGLQQEGRRKRGGKRDRIEAGDGRSRVGYEGFTRD